MAPYWKESKLSQTLGGWYWNPKYLWIGATSTIHHTASSPDWWGAGMGEVLYFTSTLMGKIVISVHKIAFFFFSSLSVKNKKREVRCAQNNTYKYWKKSIIQEICLSTVRYGPKGSTENICTLPDVNFISFSSLFIK